MYGCPLDKIEKSAIRRRRRGDQAPKAPDRIRWIPDPLDRRRSVALVPNSSNVQITVKEAKADTKYVTAYVQLFCKLSYVPADTPINITPICPIPL